MGPLSGLSNILGWHNTHHMTRFHDQALLVNLDLQFLDEHLLNDVMCTSHPFGGRSSVCKEQDDKQGDALALMTTSVTPAVLQIQAARLHKAEAASKATPQPEGGCFHFPDRGRAGYHLPESPHAGQQSSGKPRVCSWRPCISHPCISQSIHLLHQLWLCLPQLR